jgi:hypothetical protein
MYILRMCSTFGIIPVYDTLWTLVLESNESLRSISKYNDIMINIGLE